MRTMSVSITNGTKAQSEIIRLPAHYDEIADAFERVNATLPHCIIQKYCDENGYPLPYAEHLESQNIQANIFEINHLAGLMTKMESYEKAKFQGVVEQMASKESMSVATMVNLAMNALQEENILHLPITEIEELGEYYIGNDFLHTINNGWQSISQDQRKWLVEYLDARVVGDEVHKQVQGTFTHDGYTIITDEIKQLYDGNFPTLNPSDYVFRLTVGKIPKYDANDEPLEVDKDNLVEIKLPSSMDKCLLALRDTGAKMLCDCVYYEFDTLIPQLERVLGGVEEIENLNELAKNIQQFKESGELPKYKALLETLSYATVETALSACEYMEEFEFDPTIATAKDYGRKLVMDTNDPSKVEMAEFMDLERYGRFYVEELGARITPYGLVKSDTGTTLEEKIELDKQKQNHEMGGISQ